MSKRIDLTLSVDEDFDTETIKEVFAELDGVELISLNAVQSRFERRDARAVMRRAVNESGRFND